MARPMEHKPRMSNEQPLFVGRSRCEPQHFTRAGHIYERNAKVCTLYRILERPIRRLAMRWKCSESARDILIGQTLNYAVILQFVRRAFSKRSGGNWARRLMAHVLLDSGAGAISSTGAGVGSATGSAEGLYMKQHW